MLVTAVEATLTRAGVLLVDSVGSGWHEWLECSDGRVGDE